MKVARGWGKGDHARIRQRNPWPTALSLSNNAILFTISMLQVKVVEKVCQDLTPWQVYKKGDTNVLQLKGCNEAKMRSNFLRVIYNYHLQKK